MGLFRRRSGKNRGKAAAELLMEQTRTAQAQAEQARAEQARAEQAQAEQARAEQARAEQARAEQARAEQAQAEVARREVSAEVRPNPDRPGWGRTIGQEIGRARESRPTQE
jgi:hypothetical protein